MNTPRWFYAVIAGCAVVLTLAASLVLLGSIGRGRYQTGGFEGKAILDTRTGTLCYPDDQKGMCVDAKGRKL